MSKSRLRILDINRDRMVFAKAVKRKSARIQRHIRHLGLAQGMRIPPRELRMISWRRF